MVPIYQNTWHHILQDGNLVSCHDNPIFTFPKLASVICITFLKIALYLWKVSSIMTVQRLQVVFPKIIVQQLRVLSLNAPCIQGRTHNYLDMQRTRLMSERCKVQVSPAIYEVLTAYEECLPGYDAV